MKSTAAKFQFDFTTSVVVEFDSISADKFLALDVEFIQLNLIGNVVIVALGSDVKFVELVFANTVKGLWCKIN